MPQLPPIFGIHLDWQSLLMLAGMVWFFLVVVKPMPSKRDRHAQRIRMIEERRAELKGQLLTPRRRRNRYDKKDFISVVRQVVAKLKLLQQLQVGELQQKLIKAGYRSKDAVIIFAFAKLAMPVGGLVVGILISGMDWDRAFTPDAAIAWLKILGTSYFGARLPEIIVANAKAKREHKLRKALPDALDLMMICAEAGLSLAAALNRVSEEIGRVSPELAEEFSFTSVELGFLPDRALALKHLTERTELKEIRGFVNVIAQTEKYGTPIAQALRVLAKEFRTERMLRAEQKAARLPAMMTVPMIVFILPTLFIIVMAPAVIAVMDNF